MTIKKILVANRGEIACRVMRSCRDVGIATVAVYSEADSAALHVDMADDAVWIGPPPARESYLDIGKIIDAAKATGADAIHPGYGFLSENEDFAEAIAKAGLIFIGPPVAAIRAMGGKSEAKALMEKAGVPLVPGYHGDNQDEKFLAAEAQKIGYPLLIKASAGGGGKGMRVVEKPGDFAEALGAARREAKAAFGDDHVLIEKYLTRPRHVEIQVFADRAGNTVYLFERDCSIQRRHQKVIEEAPAPGLAPETRAKMGAAAVAAAKAIGYEGAGTVEFLLDTDGSFYFMEMNTRLQVEHPVTEMITGLDLVALQISVAEGQDLPFTQDDLAINGHAIEVRLYAEDPANNFLPGAGQIQYLSFPLQRDAVRVDTGVREAPFGDGDVISIHYDPMIAKIIVHGADRAQAIERLSAALADTHVAGPKTNLNFLRAIAAHPAFAAADLDTRFIERHADVLLPAQKPRLDNATLALAALGVLHLRAEAETAGIKPAADPTSPWQHRGGWRIGGADTETLVFNDGTSDCSVKLSCKDGLDSPVLSLPDGSLIAARFAPAAEDMGFYALLEDEEFHAVALRDGNRLTVMHTGVGAEMVWHDPLNAEFAQEDTAGRLTAPMPGKVVAVRVQLGDAVKKGQPLVIVEAMKMEHTIVAPVDGKVTAINANIGEQVDEKRELIALE
ncbi:MAG: acetyl/propionyl/methylcrotonyl-CoA carboxylase subunit alpha [Alphaproteobacteria bacterium]|nr:acetyl/propionyl/methylcrotonyl-CoA carboxylase subunit alpha [Alphaproteobacteria bacterium]